MSYEEFFVLVAAMRAAQKAWFSRKQENHLRDAKRLEKAVDEVLRGDPRQGQLFSQNDTLRGQADNEQ